MATSLGALPVAPWTEIGPPKIPTGIGRLAVRPKPDGEVQPLPVRALDVRARIEGLLSEVVVTTRFANVFTVPLRATYIFPLPWDGAATRFTMRCQGRTVIGRVFERGEAIERHEDALARGKTSSLLEEEASETFTLEVGNIPPGEDVEIELVLVAPVTVDAGRATWRFPLVCGEKYIPGAPLREAPVGTGIGPDTDVVPGGSRLNPPRLLPGVPNPIALGISIELAPGLAADDSFDGTLPLVRSAADDGTLRFVLGDISQDPDRDLVLRWRMPDAAFSGDLRVAKGPDGRHYFGGTLFTPPREGAAAARSVLVLVDRSGSMAGWKMESARRVAGALIDGLGAHDEFNVIAFDNAHDPLWKTTRPANAENKQLARTFVAALAARGGTELGTLLMASLQQLAAVDEGREPAILLVTDAQVGDEQRIVTAARKAKGRVAVWSVGVDASLNAGILGQLARETGAGVVHVARPADEGEALDAVARLLALPSVRKLALDGPVTDVVPVPRALHGGVPLLVSGVFEGPPVPLSIKGAWPDGTSLSITLTPREGSTTLIPARWAKLRVRELEHEFAERHDPSVEQRLVNLAVTHQVLSRFTAYLAIDEASNNTVGGDTIELTQPVETKMMALEAPCVEFSDCPAFFERDTDGFESPAQMLAPRRAPEPPPFPFDELRDLVRRLASACQPVHVPAELLQLTRELLHELHARGPEYDELRHLLVEILAVLEELAYREPLERLRSMLSALDATIRRLDEDHADRRRKKFWR